MPGCLAMIASKEQSSREYWLREYWPNGQAIPKVNSDATRPDISKTIVNKMCVIIELLNFGLHYDAFTERFLGPG